MMRNNRQHTPVMRLRDAPTGSVIRLVGDGTTRTFEATEARPDGYFDLYQKGRLCVTASPGHLVEIVK